ncbi:MAG: periplasmic heavy metal sensor [Maricaulaceae bacterium]|nr:periplasmic heavy metal sensor [Maricaulaceae bacterium]
MSRATPWIAALVISVLANGVLLGFVLHRGLSQQTVEPPPQEMRTIIRGGFSMMHFMRSLPEEARERARERMRAEWPRLRALGGEIREAQAGAEAALRAEPFEPDTARAAMTELRQAREAMETAVEALVLDMIAELPPEQRARALEQGRHGPHRRGGGPRGHGGGPPERR